MSQLIPLPEPEALPAAESIAQSELARVNALLESRINSHKQRFAAFWANPQASPDEILAAMGTNAVLWLQAASESAGHIARLAAIVGQTLDDFLPPEFYAPRRPFVIGQDGSVTLEPESEPEEPPL